MRRIGKLQIVSQFAHAWPGKVSSFWLSEAFIVNGFCLPGTFLAGLFAWILIENGHILDFIPGNVSVTRTAFTHFPSSARFMGSHQIRIIFQGVIGRAIFGHC
jgi:hypothetical protein